MPTPGPGVPISFAQVNTEFVLTTPSPMDIKYRIAPGTYTPAAPVIPTTPASTFPVDLLHNRTCTSFVATFTTPGVWTSAVTGDIKVLVVGGGGAGGSRIYLGNAGAGGGGGGGVVHCTSFPVISGVSYPYTVGLGGLGTPTANPTNGQNSDFNGSIIAIGGGRGGFTPTYLGSPGGSGGGTPVTTAAIGVQPAQPQPPNCTNYGNNGGVRNPGPAPSNPLFLTGGGGGAGTVGAPAPGIGGNGIVISITGSPVYYGAGGGGANAFAPEGAGVKPGGLGGGGAGSVYRPFFPSTSATPGTFYGAGGGGGTISTASVGGNGYPGCVIIAYP